MDLHASLRELRRVSARAAVSAPDVSAWSVGMHVEHCGKVMLGVSRALVESPQPAPPIQRSWAGRLVFLIGRIPRGRGKAPEAVVPSGDLAAEDLAALLDRAGDSLEQAAAADAGAWFRHFVFGVLDREATLEFLRIHNRHHLRIIDDILAAGGG